jgi:O-Antigen ligase
MLVPGTFDLHEGSYESAAGLLPRNLPLAINSGYSGPFALIRLCVLIILPFVLVDGAIYQLQMLVVGGRAPMTAAVLKVALLVLLMAAALFRSKITNSMPVKIGLIFIAYLILDLLFLYFNLGLDFADILVSYNIYYLIFLIDVLALCVPLRISDRVLVRAVIVCFLICAPLGFAQYFTQRPIVPTQSGDDNFRVLVWTTAGGIRAFSLFIAPGSFGMFSSLVAAMSIAMCGRRRNWFFALPLFLMSVFACWISLTRTDLVGLVCAIITACVITFSAKRHRAKWLPLIYLPLGILVGLYAFIQSSSGSGTHAITDTTSFTERLYEWSYYLGTFRLDNWPTWLFGSGLVQSEKVHTNASIVPIDNLYLAITLHTGLIGLALAMALFWSLWDEIRKKAEARTSYLYTAVAASLSTLWCVGLFQVAWTSLGAMVLLCAVSRIDARERDSAPTIRSEHAAQAEERPLLPAEWTG